MRRILAIGGGSLLFAVALLFPGVASGAGYWGPGFRICRHFKDGAGAIYVSAQHLPCGKAERIAKEYWLAPPSRKELVGPDEYNGYVRLKRFPGWRCTQGAGGAGGCHKGRRVAAYNTFYP